MTQPVIRTRGAEAHVKAVRHAMDMLEAGQIGGVNCHYESTTGLGRVSFTTIDGVDVELPPFDLSDIENQTPPTKPGKGLSKSPGDAGPTEET